MLLGGSENGKTTLLNLVETFPGEFNVAHELLKKLNEHERVPARPNGRLANIDADMSDQPPDSMGMFKRLTGGDLIHGEVAFEEPVKFTNHATLMFACNKMPVLDDDTRGKAAVAAHPVPGRVTCSTSATRTRRTPSRRRSSRSACSTRRSLRASSLVVPVPGRARVPGGRSGRGTGAPQTGRTGGSRGPPWPHSAVGLLGRVGSTCDRKLASWSPVDRGITVPTLAEVSNRYQGARTGPRRRSTGVARYLTRPAD